MAQNLITAQQIFHPGFGHGARGEHQYHVDINFYKPVDITVSSCVVICYVTSSLLV